MDFGNSYKKEEKMIAWWDAVLMEMEKEEN